MLYTYRLVYPISEHAPPQLWEYEQSTHFDQPGGGGA
jgi:hypothetical protein